MEWKLLLICKVIHIIPTIIDTLAYIFISTYLTSGCPCHEWRCKRVHWHGKIHQRLQNMIKEQNITKRMRTYYVHPIIILGMDAMDHLNYYFSF